MTARHLFQERWLRDQGKVQEIEPSPDASRAPSLAGWPGVFARVGYSTIYGTSFGVAFPVYLAGAVFAPVTDSIRSGFRDGARAAIEGVDDLLGATAGRNGIARPALEGSSRLAGA